VLILGGKKVTTKINTIINLLPKIDIMLIGGLMAYVFLAAQGDSIGATEIEADEEKKKKEIEEAFRIMEESKKYNVPIILPHYHVAIDEMRNIVDVFTHIPPGYKGVDIGEATINTFCKHISKAKTILWNGPLGMVEDPRFMYGSKRIAEFIANLPPEVTRIACGGDTDTVIDNLQLAPKFTYVSTAGGAMLEFLEGKNLPGLVPFLVS
jgi:phosphoglycerate kinase